MVCSLTLALNVLHQVFPPLLMKCLSMRKALLHLTLFLIFHHHLAHLLLLILAPFLQSLPSIKAGVSSPKWEGNIKMPHIISGSKVSTSGAHKGVNQSSVSSLASSQGRGPALQKLSPSKSDQDLASLRSSHTVEVSSLRVMDDEYLRLLNDSSRSTAPSRLLSPPCRPTGPQVSWPSAKLGASRNPLNGSIAGSTTFASSNAFISSPIPQIQDSAAVQNTSDAALKPDKISRKRTLSDMLNLFPSLQGVDIDPVVSKRRLSESGHQPSSHALFLSDKVCKTERCSYGDLIAEANKGNTPSSVYILTLLHVVRHCSLCIKHALLTSQMEALDIPYVEEAVLGNAFSNIWFRVPSSRDDSWPHICLRLGRPGSMYWDVKINDRHFRDLWKLQKGSNNTPWGSGVHIANTSNVDSHIRYDSEGIILSYQSVEGNSIKKLVADIHRLSNARMFALGMQKLLGERMEQKLEVTAPSDGKTMAGVKDPLDGVGKLSEQLKKAFRIEAVGLMSFWFSFGSGVLARFVVEWESGKDGCTMHVSPDGLWPHTKYLEDFINGGEVASLLDCIRLTAGPLHALAAATRPARAGQAVVIPGVTASMSSVSKQSTYLPGQGLLPSGSITNAGHATSNSLGVLLLLPLQVLLGTRASMALQCLPLQVGVAPVLFLAHCYQLMFQLYYEAPIGYALSIVNILR
ncbi:hypothetical protein Nepgr_001446 [Nepenthes gracilis]|uniref:Uncharacterized protein n=1 Tax=Nepenthes gracilis TaxID=150966 RepID=A0AAD3P575_NEPGR|nr:hypothetical protein Nepgr_001446 [Nepenthes gracilis]